MNRTITEPFSPALPADRQGEFFHRYVLGVYDLYARLTAAFPAILFESCASGGGRFDPGMLAFAPQAWTSDDTDAIERLRIQWGTSLAYPLSSMGAHVAAVPNHQTGRMTPLATRAAVAFFGVFGYELDPTVLDPEERAAVAEQIKFYKANRELFQRGRFVRLRSPYEGDGNQTAWSVVAPDASRAVVGYYLTLNRPVPAADRLRLRGLDPAAVYRVTGWPADDGDVLIAGQCRPARRGRADAGRAVARRRSARRPPGGATSAPGCSSSKPSDQRGLAAAPPARASPGLALRRAERQAADELLGQRQVHDDRRHGHETRPRPAGCCR